MSGINISSINRIQLVGKVVGEVRFAQAGGRETCQFTLETVEHLVIKGESRAVTDRHEVIVGNRISVASFKNYGLRDGHYLDILGKLTNGKIRVTDFGHAANFMYVVPDNAVSPPVRQAPSRGGAHSPDRSGKAPSGGQDDGYFNEGAAFDRTPPSKRPEGFTDDDIPY